MSDQTRKFIYCDAKGEFSIREVVNVSESDDYMQGYCLAADGIRTFRKDRVLETFPDGTPFELGEERLAHHISQGPPDSVKVAPRGPPRPHNALDVCFTGFKKDDKDRLTTLASENDLIVRANVTQYLTFLCYGYNAGPKKMEKARHQGVVILSEHQFLHMLESGEIPEDPE